MLYTSLLAAINTSIVVKNFQDWIQNVHGYRNRKQKINFCFEKSNAVILYGLELTETDHYYHMTMQALSMLNTFVCLQMELPQAILDSLDTLTD